MKDIYKEIAESLKEGDMLSSMKGKLNKKVAKEIIRYAEDL